MRSGRTWLRTILHLDVRAVASSPAAVLTILHCCLCPLFALLLLALLQLAAARDEDRVDWAIILPDPDLCNLVEHLVTRHHLAEDVVLPIQMLARLQRDEESAAHVQLPPTP